MLTLNSSVTDINKIAKAAAKKLHKLGIKTVDDLLRHYPVRHNDYTRTLPIASLQAGESANVQGSIEFIQNKRSWRTRLMITEALVSDGTGQLKVVWFNQPFIGHALKPGELVSLAGAAQADFAGLQMVSPEYEKLTASGTTHTAGLVPVYALTAGLTNKQLRFLIKSVIALSAGVSDYLPRDIIKTYKLSALSSAWRDIHFPKNQAALAAARRRLQFDELFFVQLANEIKKLEFRSQKSEPIAFNKKKTQEFVKNLPFVLTDAQKKAAWEIIKDLQSDKPMARLLEGDVGSGKTVTAAIAMYNTALDAKQSALLAPTEILAGQHYDTLCGLFQNSEVSIGLFTRSNIRVNSKQLIANSKQLIVNSKKEMLQLLQNGDINIVVGTHAIIEENVRFKNLALAVIDEQHRFGVAQRQKLREKSGGLNTVPHLLSMTATPIPRTLAQVFYGDLDISIINQLPAGRRPIKTFVVPESKRAGAYDFIKKEITSGRQAFVVCPLISESDKLGVKSVEQEYKKLNEEIFPELAIAYLHGKLKAVEKEEIMQKFLAKEIQVLISTSVIEVGVDVPNASIMLIEGAERFGLAQLHQFRGRVGRASHQSYCLLFPTDERQAAERLRQFAATSDGFKLAEQDLKQRGPGEVYGRTQKGFVEFKIADLNDRALLKETRAAAQAVAANGLEKYPQLVALLTNKDEAWTVG